MTAHRKPDQKTFTDILQLTPEEIQAWLDTRLAHASPEVQRAILKVDYVEPGSVRDPTCQFYVRVGQYEGMRDVLEIAFQAAPGADTALMMVLRLL